MKCLASTFPICTTLFQQAHSTKLLSGVRIWSIKVFQGWRDGSVVKSTLVTLPEDLGSFPSTYMWFIALYNRSPRASTALFWPLQAPGMRVWCTGIHAEKTIKHISVF